jgi:Alr-MurF fusion protein
MTNFQKMILTAFDISKIVGGSLTGNPDHEISDIFIDSRQLNFTEGRAFIAIHGQNHNGHDFIRSLYGKGIRSFIVEKLPADIENFKDAAFILTDDSIVALQKLAASKRKLFKSDVIAITGSTGKTIVKEWLADILGLNESVIRSPRSYNSQIGVPLSVWKLDKKYKAGIFEAGISMPGEMEKLREIIDPGIGVITNIGDAHSENFPDNTAKAKEKLKLFVNSSLLVYSRDQKLLHELIRSDKLLNTKRLIDWSFSDKNAAVFVNKKQLSENRTQLGIAFEGHTFKFIIPFDDRASVENATTVTAVCLALKIDRDIIMKGLANLVPVAMRMEVKAGINGCRLVEDYYNSDPGSLGMAIDYLRNLDHKKTTLILSDFVESGRDEKELYKEIATLIRRSGIDKFIGIGPLLTRNSSLFGASAHFYYSTEEFIHRFNAADFRNEIILIKGARKYEFERIGAMLEQQAHQTVLEVNLDAIAHNLNEFRRFLDPGTRIMAMVKAFAYGAGPSEISALLEYHRVSYLGVAFVDEGIQLRNAGVTLPVMVMNPEFSSSEQIIKYNLEPEIYSFYSLSKFTEAASRHGLVQYPIHIKIDSGMHRLGFMPEEVDELAKKIGKAESLKVISVFSHFAAADIPALDYFTHIQAQKFLEAVTKIRKETGYSFLRHICNSAGIARFPQYQFEMVRPGIGIYGIGDFEGIDLKAAGRFKTRISQIKRIPAGEPVGYNCADVSDKDRTIGILQAGYADGLNRKLGNRNGSLLIRNTRVPIIGNICMDMCMADLTGLNAEVGDEAEIFGNNISINEIAAKCETIPYEILTSIPGRVKRVFFSE